jgi:hypothetical protein
MEEGKAMAVLAERSKVEHYAAPIINVDRDTCREFIDILRRDGVNLSSLDALRDQSVFGDRRSAVETLIGDLQHDVTRALSDPDCGIIALDIPSGIEQNPTADTLMGAVIAAAVGTGFMTPTIDVRNGTPFTLYNASADNEAALKQAGVKFFSPNEKLGFHTDGRISGEAVYVPETLLIYNILIAYRRPGNFYWVPFNLWTEKDRFAEALGWNTAYRFEMTPIVYSGSAGQVSASAAKAIEAPIFWRDDQGNSAIFMNGEVIGKAGELGEFRRELVESMKDSISSNPARLAIPQKARRLLLMNNTAGFHARDIFNDPIAGTRYTRSFMRSVSMEGPCIYN